jgi:hypothetical protein
VNFIQLHSRLNARTLFALHPNSQVSDSISCNSRKPDDSTSNMVQMVISEFVANSLGYAAFESGTCWVVQRNSLQES